ncbi:MAG: tetratricopeptide repeat protein [Candidatus Binatia bacterium]
MISRHFPFTIPHSLFSIRHFLFTIHYLLFTILFVVACGRPSGFGIGGRYLDAKSEIVKRRGNINRAITKLEYVVRRDPFYEDSLTLLGRAYYKRGRYQDAFEILKRALAVNPEDEIAWIMLGLTQLRLGDDIRGLESFKGGLTLLSKVSKDGYRGLDFWDKNRLVRSALRKAILYVSKGLEEKKRIIQSGEILLARIDDEEWFGKREQFTEDVRVDK